jgi:peptidoglycan hydrolase-like protein with peptidoglycan-binding domain
MTRILVRPSDLQSLSVRLTQAVGDLQTTAERLRRAAQGLAWEVRADVAVAGQVESALRLAAALARHGGQMALFLSEKARDFTELDLALARDLEKALGTYTGVLDSAVAGGALGLGGLGQAVGKWAGVGMLGGSAELGGAVGSAALGGFGIGVPLVTGGIGTLKERFPGAFGPEPVVAPPGPARGEARLPTDAELRYIQQVFGIREEGYGPLTKEAVRKLQARHGIPVDAAVMIGPLTWTALLAEGKLATSGGLAHAPVDGPGPGAGDGANGGDGWTFKDSFIQSAADLEARLTAMGEPGVARWAGLIMKVAEQEGIRPEYIAVAMILESHGEPNAGAGGHNGQGLMQVEFYAHKDLMVGETDADKQAWILEPENNVRIGARLLKEQVKPWVQQYGPDEGLKRALQYYNYGSGAQEWVEAHSKSPEDWQHWVTEYHNTHAVIDGQSVEVPNGHYGDDQYGHHAAERYQQLQDLGGGAPAGEQHAAPVEPAPSPAEHSAFDGYVPAEGTTNENVAAYVTPPLTSTPGDRSGATYTSVINQFAVEKNGRYVVRDFNGDGHEDTFCNIYVWDVTRAMGAEVPHWVAPDGTPLAPGHGNELNANGVVNWLADHGPGHGWHEVPAADAQAWANQGKPAVAAWENPAGPGHVAMVRPGEYSAATGPGIAQAGAKNSGDLTVSAGFGETRMAQVRYYVHE